MDGLGALLTYPQLQHTLRIEFARARRYSYPLCCLVVQVDGLGRIRDLHGSGPRDEILGRLVRMLQAQARASDAIALYQDRVALLLPHTDESGARTVAERIRERVRSEGFLVAGKELKFTVSIGLSTFAEKSTIFYDSILKNAEGALQAASDAGGDRLEVAAPGPGGAGS
jgi:diguanylate cyclase (GGDEF)-like protein